MNQQETPLFTALHHYAAAETTLHVPGHKNGTVLPPFAKPFYERLLQLDATEVSGLDDLHAPEDVILKSQQLLTEHYGTIHSYFLVNGSTVGNLAMILATLSHGDEVIVQRNCHKSILHGIELTGATPIFVAPHVDSSWQVATTLSIEETQRVISEHPQAKALILTYPNYYGIAQQQIKTLIDFAHAQNLVVLVDEAHGAHFTLAQFPSSTLDWGADVVIHSAHKTLPAMTMGSYLHINSQRVSDRRIRYYLQMLQSSSPSYPIMASLDIARFYLAHYIEETPLRAHIQTFRKALNDLRGIHVLEAPTGTQLDPLKVTIRADGLTGFELADALEAVGILPELADFQNVLFVLPLAIVDYSEILETIAQIKWQPSSLNMPSYRIPFETTIALSYEQMHESQITRCPIAQAVDQISAETIIPYPPGIPLIMKGERIRAETVVQLQKMIAHDTHFHGGEYLTENDILLYK